MEISYDYRELFKVLNKYKVRYLIAGAYAVSFYTQPRFTKDLDIWVEPEIKNANELYKALKEFGAPLKGIQPIDFVNKKIIYQIGVAPIRVDIMMSLVGLDFTKAWQNRKITKYANISVNILGLEELIISKKRFKREQDSMDLKKLKKVKS